MSDFVWPDVTAILDELKEEMAVQGHGLSVRSQADLEAGFARAKTAEMYSLQKEPGNSETATPVLAALLFDGLATRHPLVDGNKRLAFMAMDTFLFLNGFELDAPEGLMAEMCLAVITGKKTMDDLAAFIRTHKFR